MAMPRKPDAEKYCLACGKRMSRKRYKGVLESNKGFSRRKYCDQKCMAEHWISQPKTGTSYSAGHAIARAEVAAGCCEICGKPNAMDVHHKDGNYQNNSPDNLMRICRSCHNKQHRVAGKCKICGKKVKGLGFCEKHYQRFKKYGNPNTIKVNQYSGNILSAD